MLSVLAACSDPLGDVDKLSDVDVATDAPRAEAVDTSAIPSPDATEPTSAKRGFLGGLFGRKEATAPAAETADSSDAPAPVAAPEAELEVASLPVQTDAPAPERRGLLGFLKSKAEEAKQADQVAEAAPVEIAALLPETGPAPAEPATARRGLFGNAASATGPRPGDVDFQEVAFGTSLPFGQIARVCNVPKGKLGKAIARWPEKGAKKYEILNSAPGSTAPRAMYLTGFGDGCARQVTSALTMFGDFEMHEQLRYGLPEQGLPYSETENAYEKLKRRECGSARGKPCGSKISAFSRTGVFVSVYQSFEGSAVWKNILLHDGRVVAMDVNG
ncbi:hypothetical protein VK792_11050 [Mesobacterium sp. TK19101]|uniref:Uncharacterized protein n=1 Tax=Mesobacterium hydrothermale TaxID=3111907 RepID=A0ABU6HH94_9RHOB|nr:hypothetical protein [Mesobacterium sp. TK19101]MEC3861823.1 hypothetical protein [Mesobacterium sp. TK19101]